MSIINVEYYGDNGKLKRWDMWFLYAAFAEFGETGLVKIGISTKPISRAREIQLGSPFPIKMLLWTQVGKRPKTSLLEARIKRAFADRNTRGEWFQFDFGCPEDKERFHSIMKAQFLYATGRQLKWRRSTKEQFMASCGMAEVA